MKYLLVLLIGFTFAFLLFKSCSKETDLENSLASIKEQLKTEQEKRKKAEQNIADLSKTIDSLENVKNKVKTQIVYREREISENISKDSSNSLVEYRRSLVDNNYLPDGTLYLSYREIGLGAILMAKIPKLELQINLQDSIIHNYKRIQIDDNFIKKSYQNSLDIKDLEISKYATALKKEQSFWNSNALWFGIGVLSTVAVVFLTK